MADGEMLEHAKFHAMTEGTQEDWMAIVRGNGPFNRELPDRMLAHLRMLKEDTGGYPVDRLEHSLQTATRAFKAGRDEEYVVCALIHDIGDLPSPSNPAQYPPISHTVAGLDRYTGYSTGVVSQCTH